MQDLLITPFMVCTGFLLNTLSILVFCRPRMRKFSLSILMASLALTDSLVLIVPVLAAWLDDKMFDFYFINNTIWCRFHGYIDLILSANSAWIIVVSRILFKTCLKFKYISPLFAKQLKAILPSNVFSCWANQLNINFFNNNHVFMHFAFVWF